MEQWTGAQRAYAVKAFYKNGDSYVIAQREFRREFEISRNNAVPSANAIKTWVRNFEATGSTVKKRGGSAKKVRTPENIAIVREAIERSPRRSARRHSVALGLSDRSVRRILHKDLHFHAYKIQIVHALQEQDHGNRLQFCETLLQLINGNQNLVNNLLMSDEAHFHLSGYVNKQNFRYWSHANPQEIHEKPLHSLKVTVWCAISSFAIIGPYFFEDERERAVTVTGERYVQMLQNFLAPAIAHLPVNEDTFFQQDGATSHTARNSMATVRNMFPNHVISRHGDIGWPARSPDLSTCDFFLWGYLKSKVFMSPAPHTIQELKNRIQNEIEQIPVEMLQRVMSDVSRRLAECIHKNGGHLTDVIFAK